MLLKRWTVIVTISTLHLKRLLWVTYVASWVCISISGSVSTGRVCYKWCYHVLSIINSILTLQYFIVKSYCVSYSSDASPTGPFLSQISYCHPLQLSAWQILHLASTRPRHLSTLEEEVENAEKSLLEDSIVFLFFWKALTLQLLHSDIANKITEAEVTKKTEVQVRDGFKIILVSSF